MKKIQFDITRALAGAKVVTRDDKEVRIAGYNPDAKLEHDQVVGWIEGTAETWCGCGSYYRPNNESEYDLFILIPSYES